MNVSVLILVLLTSTVLFSSRNRVHGSPNFDFEKASKSAADLETSIELTIAVKKSYGIARVANNLCVTSTRPVDGEAWTEYHSTEYVPFTRSPTFTSKVKIPYLLKDKLELQFAFYDELGKNDHDPKSNLSFKGYARCKLADLVSARKITLPITDSKGKNRIHYGIISLGYVTVYADRLSNEYHQVNLRLKSENTTKSSICGARHHYFEIYKRIMVEEEASNNEDDYAIIYRTEEKQYGKKEWKPISLPWSTLSTIDLDHDTRDLKFVCRSENHEKGEFNTTLKELQECKADFDLSTQKSSAAGRISIFDFYIKKVSSFADFMAVGLEIYVTIAVDFTRGSGLPENPKSFHYRSGGENKCEKAIRLVVNAFQDYVSNNTYDIRGFGARKYIDDYTSRPLSDFKLYKDEERGGVRGSAGAIQAYRVTLYDKSIQMGPGTNFAEAISKFADRAAKLRTPNSNSYSVLVVLAAGKFEADQEIKEVMKSVRSNKPLSIILVSIGDADLTEVQKIYRENSRTSLQDNFHFVSVYESDLLGDDDSNAFRRTELLAKLPEQIVSYMHSINLKPKPRQ